MGNNGAAPPPSNTGRPAAADVARLDGNLTHVLVSPEHGEGVQVFVNARALPPGSLDSVTVSIEAPNDDGRSGGGGGITGVIAYYSGESGSGGATRPQSSQPLFPGTVEFVARDRRIVVSCREENSFDGLYLGLGLRDDGTTTELTGVRSVRVTITPSLIDARLVWSEDGSEEDLLPEG